MLTIELVSAKKPGAKHNEDLFGFKGDTFWLLDGATSTDGPPLERDAYWLVHELDTALNGLVPLEMDVAVMAAAACSLVAGRWPGSAPQRPVAAMAVWRVRDGKLTAAITGNVSLLVPQTETVIELTDERVLPAHEGANTQLLAAVAQGMSFESAEFKALRQRMKHREAGALDINAGGWLASAAERHPDDFMRHSAPLSSGLSMLAATDGFMELRRYWQVPNNVDFLKRVHETEGRLPGAIQQLRASESGADSGQRFPRTKRYDDATAVLLRVP
jgi:hypothetical protein